MATKKRVSYQNLLKEAISEFDTSKTVDVKGPMLDPILKWDGQGEVPIYKDAASILERYYFDENSDKGVEVAEMEYNENGTEAKTASEKPAEGEGTEQAGTSSKPIAGEKKEIAKDLAKEAEEIEAEEDEEEITEQEEAEEEDKEEDEKITEDLENSVIEKLIAEMEEEDAEEDDAEAVEEMDSMKDAQGAGTQQAGTGPADKEVPDRKDVADKMTKPANVKEQDEPEEEEEEELDVDKKIKEGSAVPGGPSPKKKGEDSEEDVYEEAFKLFKESIEEDDEEEEDDSE